MEYNFNKDQEIAMQLMQAGHNVFVTGEAGSGKSYVVNAFCKTTQKSIIKVAPTGIAAINIGGSTIHRTFGIKTGVCIRRPRSPLKVLGAVDIVLIDEISMCRIDLFEYVMGAIQLAEKSYKRKIQVICVGDFFQLPPVVGENDEAAMIKFFENRIYAFESLKWNEMKFQTVILKTQMRQSGESEAKFVDALNKIRVGDAGGISYINRCNCKEYIEKELVLAGTNRVVSTINETELDKLSEELRTFESEENGDVKASDRIAPKNLEVKIGAEVMTLINDPDGEYQNGSTGIIIDIKCSHVKRFDNNEKRNIDSYEECIYVKIKRTERVVKIPRYKWDVKKYILKSEMDEELEREKMLKEFDDFDGFLFSDVKEEAITEEIKKTDEVKDSDADKTEDKKDDLIEITVGTILQFPLRLAYAVTIHKSQGQTYDAVNLKPFCWDYGQLYVALSRCKHLSTMHVDGFIMPKYLKTDPRVLKFYAEQEQAV